MDENTPTPEPSTTPNPRRFGRKTKVAAIATAATLTAAAFVGAGMAIDANATPADTAMTSTGTATAPTTMPMTTPASPTGNGKHEPKNAEALRAWAHKYGQDRDTMPMYPDVSSATPEQQAAATTLLEQTQADTSQYSDLAAARAAGYDLQAALTKAEKKHPGLAKVIAAVDAGTMPKRMPMLHVANTDAKSFAVLDPQHPQTLMYEYTGSGNWKLIGVMYTAAKAFPNAPADPGGPITRWHYHPKSGATSLMMHVFFVPGNDLAHAYATEMS